MFDTRYISNCILRGTWLLFYSVLNLSFWIPGISLFLLTRIPIEQTLVCCNSSCTQIAICNHSNIYAFFYFFFSYATHDFSLTHHPRRRILIVLTNLDNNSTSMTLSTAVLFSFFLAQYFQIWCCQLARQRPTAIIRDSIDLECNVQLSIIAASPKVILFYTCKLFCIPFTDSPLHSSFFRFFFIYTQSLHP